tara:strand:+ start:135 stop:905 length:771 start_codon:yes stop_codon:yes gene_type:complete
MNSYISVAIPHYNNVKYIEELLREIIHDERINEIIICDDSSKQDEIKKLTKLVLELTLEIKKIKLFINKTNLGCYHNKLHTLTKCTNDWACLIDSDNIIDKNYIDTLFSFDEWNTSLIYTPMWAKTFRENSNESPSPNLNYSQFKNLYIDSNKYIELFNSNNNINFKCLINNCNYFLPVKQYLNVMKKYNYQREKIDCLDSNVLFSDWIYNNNKVYVVENLIYKHRLHNESNYMLSESKQFSREVEKNILKKLKGE